MDDIEYNDASSNPTSDEHLPVGTEIVEEDDQISQDVLDDLNGEDE